MGTTCVPNFKNSCLHLFSKFYRRFINDIFFLWNGTVVVQLQEFIKKLNNRHPAIKFDFKYPKTSQQFLEATVYKNNKEIKLVTSAYCKPTGRRNFLHCTSPHPRFLIKNVPHSQTLRMKNICAETTEFSF